MAIKNNVKHTLVLETVNIKCSKLYCKFNSVEI